jgi:hypothetical protein
MKTRKSARYFPSWIILLHPVRITAIAKRVVAMSALSEMIDLAEKSARGEKNASSETIARGEMTAPSEMTAHRETQVFAMKMATT